MTNDWIFSAPMVCAILDGLNPWVWVIEFKRVEASNEGHE